MRARKAQRIRFAILAARYRLERERMTPSQIDELNDRHYEGWVVGDPGTLKAHYREWLASKERWLKWRQ